MSRDTMRVTGIALVALTCLVLVNVACSSRGTEATPEPASGTPTVGVAVGSSAAPGPTHPECGQDETLGCAHGSATLPREGGGEVVLQYIVFGQGEQRELEPNDAEIAGVLDAAVEALGESTDTPVTPSDTHNDEGARPDPSTWVQAEWDGFFSDVLHELRIAPSPERLEFMREWARWEGAKASWNPLNTKREAAGATRFNTEGSGVKNYPSRDAGVGATVETLHLSHYDAIRAWLAGGSFDASTIADAVQVWGTVHFADEIRAGWTPTE